MSLNVNPDARMYHLLTRHRFEEAVILLANRKTNGSIYFAGFAVECILKALILANSTPKERPRLRESLVRVYGHNLDALQREAGRRGLHMQGGVIEEFRRINTWDNNFRYDPRIQSGKAARRLLTAAESVILWAQRIGGFSDEQS